MDRSFASFLAISAVVFCILGFNSSVFAGSVSISAVVTGCGNNARDNAELCDGYDLGGESCSSLGYNAGTLGCLASCEYELSNCLSAAPLASTTATINPSVLSSSTLTNPDATGVIFSFPINFYNEDVKLQANSYSNDFFSSNKPAPSEKSFVGKTYDFSFTAVLDQHQVATTSVAVDISLVYSSSETSGLDESSFAPYRWGAGDASWQPILGYTLDTTQNKIYFSTTHFSSFAIFGSLSQQSLPSVGGNNQTSGGGSNGGGGLNVPSFWPNLFTYVLPPSPKPIKNMNADLNGDGKTNIVDLSILLYHFDKSVVSGAFYDLNDDGKIDIVDVSILLYYWT